MIYWDWASSALDNKMLEQDFEDIQKTAMPNFQFQGKKLADIITDLFPYLFGAAGIILVLYLLSAGFGLMTSGGDPKKIQSAQGKITNAIVGIVIIFTSFWIVQLVGKFLGVENITNIFK